MTNPYEIKYNLIVESCKIEPDHNKIQNYIGDIDDWSSLLSISYAHGVLPLVYKALKKQKNIPQETLNMFKMQNMQIAQKNMQMTAELVRIVKLFDKNDIETLAFKGPTLSQTIHGNVIGRQYADLDILISKKDLYKAGKLLYKNNYESEYSIEFLKNNMLLKIEKDFTLTHKDNKISIELHWRLFEDKLIYRSNLNYFTESHTDKILNNQKIIVLSKDKLLLYLALHGSKHYWERIEWIVDIDRLIRNTNIDWKRQIFLAKQLEMENIFYFCLSVSYRMFNTPISIEIEEKTKKHDKIQVNITKVFDLIYANNIGNTNLYAKVRLKNWKNLQDNIQNTFITKSKFFFQLQDKDIYTINLPSQLSNLYYLIAYYRTLKRYLTKLFDLKHD